MTCEFLCSRFAYFAIFVPFVDNKFFEGSRKLP